jgi:hypothetical protein
LFPSCAALCSGPPPPPELQDPRSAAAPFPRRASPSSFLEANRRRHDHRCAEPSVSCLLPRPLDRRSPQPVLNRASRPRLPPVAGVERFPAVFLVGECSLEFPVDSSSFSPSCPSPSCSNRRNRRCQSPPAEGPLLSNSVRSKGGRRSRFSDSPLRNPLFIRSKYVSCQIPENPLQGFRPSHINPPYLFWQINPQVYIHNYVYAPDLSLLSP